MTEPCRLYLITPDKIEDVDHFAAALEEALSAGNVACVQLRLKGADEKPANDDDILAAAKALAPIAKKYDVAFLINDRPDLAVSAKADGVHVGQSDMACREARDLLGPDATVGVTCHASRHLAIEAGEASADYVAFGAFFPTETKATTARPDPALLSWWGEVAILPSVAIGGITPENCGRLVEAGADFLAVSSAIWNDADGPGAAVKKFIAAIAAAKNTKT